MTDRREPGPHDQWFICRCGADVFHPCLLPRGQMYDRTTGERHACFALREHVRDIFECLCGAIVYGLDGVKYATPMGLTVHQCPPKEPPPLPRARPRRRTVVAR